jgi:hypothetical protein
VNALRRCSGHGGNRPAMANGAPSWGAATNHATPGYQACTSLSGRLSALADSPDRLASRGWSRVGTRMSCPDVSWSVLSLYDGSCGL